MRARAHYLQPLVHLWVELRASNTDWSVDPSLEFASNCQKFDAWRAALLTRLRVRDSN
ncbi:hypothetical protein RA210_U460003 [Rubrivivax sp. A210]|nr:hypothetical protein RA210_U460003 [Rubrivivax sp. A210]